MLLAALTAEESTTVSLLSALNGQRYIMQNTTVNVTARVSFLLRYLWTEERPTEYLANIISRFRADYLPITRLKFAFSKPPTGQGESWTRFPLRFCEFGAALLGTPAWIPCFVTSVRRHQQRSVLHAVPHALSVRAADGGHRV